MHSQASIDKAIKMLGYEPKFNVKEGLQIAGVPLVLK